MGDFAKSWHSDGKPVLSRVKDRVSPNDPLKPKIIEAERLIKVQMSHIDQALARIASRDAAIFQRVVSSLQKKDIQRAALYANELSEVRKLGKLVTQAKLALEQVVLRLDTIQDIGDAVTVISPVMSVVRSVGSDLTNIMPNAQGEIGEINNILSDILVNAGSLSGERQINTETSSEEADRILDEASSLAEERMRDLFPEVVNKPVQQKQREPLDI
ncbi:MAG: Snf7 family protein [Thaumarchaeota archaeon]|nr:Snf7 family protein [Nitrososphaerota archaeon]MCL5318993.1 Snf7 family protein [Nitrososphaerota archaeon]